MGLKSPWEFFCGGWGNGAGLWLILLKYLLLAEFSVRTINYGSSFFPSIYGPSAKLVRNLQYGPKKRG